MEASEKASVASRKAPRRIIFTFCNLLRDVRDEKKKTKTVVPKWILPPYPKKLQIFRNFTATSPVPIRRSGQTFTVIGPRIAANYGL